MIYNAKKKEKPLFLMVCPTAALGVWKSGCRKFEPKLPVRVWHGPERKNDAIPEKGVIVT